MLRDLDKAIDAYELLKQTYPRDAPARLQLGTTYRSVGRLEDGLAESQESVRLSRGGALNYGTLASSYMQLNRFEEAKAVVKTAMDQKSEIPAMHSILAQIAFIEGDAQGAQRELELWRPAPLARIASQAQTAGFNGRLGDVRKLVNQTTESAQSAAARQSDAALALAILASFEALFGNDTQARTAVQESLRLSPLEPAIAPPANAPFVNALSLAVAGHVESLNALEQLQRASPQDTLVSFVVLPTARAASEIRAGDPAKAIALLDAAKPFEPGLASLRAIYVRGQAYLRTMAGPEAAAEFQKILDHRGVDPLSVLYPLSHLGLGRAHVLSGELARARKSYQDFFAIWKDADPDLPILIQAKQEYARLN